MQFFISQQLSIFIFALLCGVVLGVINEPFRFLRYIGFNSKTDVFIQDVIFMVLAAFITFFFSLCYNKGDVRAFILLGELIGFLLFRFTVGLLTGKIFYIIYLLFNKIFSFIKKIIKLFVTILIGFKDFILVKFPLFNKTKKTSCHKSKIYCIIIKSVSKFNRKLFKR